MNDQTLLHHIHNALQCVRHPRYFKSERGFQGAFYAELYKTISEVLLPKGALLEEEYQKNLREHGLEIRPDIIIHEEFDETRHSGRDQGNIAVMELKLKASKRGAVGDFESLIQMIQVLRYPIGIFINIGSELTHAGLVPEEGKGLISCFAVSLRDGNTHVILEQP